MQARHLFLITLVLFLSACKQAEEPAAAAPEEAVVEAVSEPVIVEREAPATEPSRFDIYSTFRLTADLSHLGDQQRQMIPLLIEAS